MRNQPNSRRRQPKTLASAAATWLAGAGILTACGTGHPQYVHCVDNNGHVIDPSWCNNGSYYGGYPTWLLVSNHHYNTGYAVPYAVRHNPHSFIPNTPAARGRVGLPPTGSLGNTRSGGGTKVGGTRGGFGHASGGSHSGGG